MKYHLFIPKHHSSSPPRTSSLFSFCLSFFSCFLSLIKICENFPYNHYQLLLVFHHLLFSQNNKKYIPKQGKIDSSPNIFLKIFLILMDFILKQYSKQSFFQFSPKKCQYIYYFYLIYHFFHPPHFSSNHQQQIK